MTCPYCQGSNLKEIAFHVEPQDIEYVCEDCHTHLLMNITPDDQVYHHEYETADAQ